MKGKEREGFGVYLGKQRQQERFIMTKQILKGGEYLVSEVLRDRIFIPENFNEEERRLADTIEKFAKNEVLPSVGHLERHEYILLRKLMEKSGDLGLMMIDVSAEYGGLELNRTTSMLAIEKLSCEGSFCAVFMAHSGIGTLPLLYYGNEEQKRKYLGKLISGEWIASYCLTEPDSGSDALAVKTNAFLSSDGRHYFLNGTKQFISNAGFADIFTVFAKVDKKHFTAFLVERTCSGITIGQEEKKMGLRGASTAQVVFEDVKVPVENVLGEIGKGHKIAFNILNIGRHKLGAHAMGAAKVAFMEATKYASLRRQFGVPICTFGAIKEKLSDMSAAIFASESIVYRLAGMLDDRLAAVPKGTPDYYVKYQKEIEEYALECAVAKVFCTEVLSFVADEVVQVFGGYGFIQDYPAERFYRDERANRIFEGTNEINRLLIAKLLFKRASKGDISIEGDMGTARVAEERFPISGTGEPLPLAAEKTLLKNLKIMFLGIAKATLGKFGERINDEQEVLMALADIAIGIFAMESVVLRAEKILCGSGEREGVPVSAVAKVFTFNALEEATAAARRAACFIEEGDRLSLLLEDIRRCTRYNSSGLLGVKRQLADAANDAGKYVFG